MHIGDKVLITGLDARVRMMLTKYNRGAVPEPSIATVVSAKGLCITVRPRYARYTLSLFPTEYIRLSNPNLPLDKYNYRALLNFTKKQKAKK